tara:strand:- start:485 stop:1030 length:546 start_codon:yes stop_codon:yes gene_type:complete
MIKLKDLIMESKVHRLQIFTTGTGGKKNMKFNPTKMPTGKLRISNQMACQNKPEGGFWTSGYREKIKSSDWEEFKRMRIPSWKSGMGAVFQVVGNPKLAVVNNNKDYEKLMKKYGASHYEKMGCNGGRYYLNWHALSKHYDGFRLTFKGSRDYIPGVHEWDVESTVWFNMKKLQFLGTIKA